MLPINVEAQVTKIEHIYSGGDQDSTHLLEGGRDCVGVRGCREHRGIEKQTNAKEAATAQTQANEKSTITA